MAVVVVKVLVAGAIVVQKQYCSSINSGSNVRIVVMMVVLVIIVILLAVVSAEVTASVVAVLNVIEDNLRKVL